MSGIPVPPTVLKKTPFDFVHRQHGARMVEFAGWEMPVQFDSVINEHRAVRERAGIFDISHMGQWWVTGPGAAESLQNLVTNDVVSLPLGRGCYALMCREDGGVVDDLYVYRLGDERFLVVVNASRSEVDAAWMRERLRPETDLIEQPQPAALAVQGPLAAQGVGLLSTEAGALTKNGVAELSLAGLECVVARTGYTGEDGFELFGPAGHVYGLYERLMRAGRPQGWVDTGLGARDTLRLEMGYSLYGHELDEKRSPLEARLGWAVKLSKPFFIGKESLLKEKANGSANTLLAFRLKDRGVPREKCEILFNGSRVGAVTSGTFSPSLNVGIALGYVESPFVKKVANAADAALVIHGRAVPAEITTLPFYKKQRG